MHPAIAMPVLLVFFAGGMVAIQAPTNAPSQLMELGEAEPLGAFDDHQR